MTQAAETARVVFRAVTADSWADFERLFEARGGPKSCWCMVWRPMPGSPTRNDGASRKAAMARIITAGAPVGLIGYLDGEPVAWCSVAPRSTYRRLVNDDRSDNEVTWSIACFFVVRRLRGQCMTERLIAAAVELAKANGASIVEGYPVDPQSPSYRFMGFTSVFEAAGFVEVARAGTRRHVYQLRVGARPLPS